MRESELLPKKTKIIPNLAEINWKYEIPDWPNTVTKDQTMPAAENDKLIFEIIEFLLNKEMVSTSNDLLKYIQNQDAEQFKLIFSKIKQQEGSYDEGIKMLDDLLKTSTNLDAVKLKGHTHFLDKNIFDSDECYVQYLKQGGPTDYNVLERLGHVYCERKAWKDAKVVYLKCVTEHPSMNSWYELAQACLRKNDLNECEDALMQANHMDHHNPNIWAFMTLLCLKYHDGLRQTQADNCLRRAFKLNLANQSLLEEIGDIYAEKDKFDFAEQCYSTALKQNS